MSARQKIRGPASAQRAPKQHAAQARQSSVTSHCLMAERTGFISTSLHCTDSPPSGRLGLPLPVEDTQTREVHSGLPAARQGTTLISSVQRKRTPSRILFSICDTATGVGCGLHPLCEDRDFASAQLRRLPSPKSQAEFAGQALGVWAHERKSGCTSLDRANPCRTPLPGFSAQRIGQQRPTELTGSGAALPRAPGWSGTQHASSRELSSCCRSASRQDRLFLPGMSVGSTLDELRLDVGQLLMPARGLPRAHVKYVTKAFEASSGLSLRWDLSQGCLPAACGRTKSRAASPAQAAELRATLAGSSLTIHPSRAMRALALAGRVTQSKNHSLASPDQRPHFA